MIEGKTESGFAYTITDERLDDYAVVKAMKAMFAGDGYAVYDLPRLLLGPDGEAALEAHCRGENGNVSRSAMLREIREILNAKPVKN